MSEFVKQLNPDNSPNVLWTPDRDNFSWPGVINQTVNEFNQTPYNQLLNSVEQHLRMDPVTHIEYGIWNGDEETAQEYSKTDAIVMFSTFASRMDHNMLLRGEFCQRVFEKLDLRDEQGKKLPLLFLAAPAGEATIPLTKDERKQMGDGDLGPAAREQLKLVRSLGYSRMALLGMSQGGSMAAAGVKEAHELGLEITHVGAASSPNMKRRLSGLLLASFGLEGKHLRADIEKGGIEAFMRVHEEEYNELKYVRAMFTQKELNYAFFRGMAKGNFSDDLALGYKDFPDLQLATAVANGDKDRVGKEKHARFVVEKLRHQAMSISGLMPHHITIEGGHHSWADRVGQVAAFYAYSLSLRR